MPQADTCSHCGAPAQASWRSCPFCGVGFKRAADRDDPVRDIANFLGALAVEGKRGPAALGPVMRGVLHRASRDDAALAAKLVDEIDALARDRGITEPMALAELIVSHCSSRGLSV